MDNVSKEDGKSSFWVDNRLNLFVVVVVVVDPLLCVYRVEKKGDRKAFFVVNRLLFL